jgi:diacylglycerol kinase family enzyme
MEVLTRRETTPIPCLLNPHAKRTAAEVSALKDDRRFQLQECEPSRLAEELRTLLRNGCARVLVAGGDGTIATAAGVLAGTNTELAILPGGTFNHFARQHGIPTDLQKARDVAATGVCELVDLGYVNDKPFLNTSVVGVYVRFVHSREKWEPSLGYWLASAWAAVRIFAGLPVYSVILEIGGERRQYRSPLVFVGVDERELKFPSLGERLADGQSSLHALVICGRARARIFAMLLAASARGVRWAARTPHLESFLLDHLTVELPHDSAYVGLDGETVRLEMPLEYRFAREALKIVVPAPGTKPDG